MHGFPILEVYPDASGRCYWPNHLITSMINCGATVGDALEASLPSVLAARSGAMPGSPAFEAAMVAGYAAVADRLERQMQGQSPATVASCGFRLAAVLDALDWYFWPWGARDPAEAGVYFRRSRNGFRQAVAASPGLEWVRIPFEGQMLDGLLVRPAGGGKPPVVVHLNGQHSSLHWHVLMGLPARLAERGIASLHFDHPGTGSARYDLGLPVRADTESYTGAAIDWLTADGRVDVSRVGVIGGSLGGYRAPRAAAFEPRIRAAIAWGAHYEMYDSVRIDWPHVGPRIPAGGPFSPDEQRIVDGLFYWTGTSDTVALDAALRTLELGGILGRIRCPLLVVHGASDAQLPLWHAERTVAEASNAPEATLLSVGSSDGGSQHCNWDNPAFALDRMSDWMAERLHSGS